MQLLPKQQKARPGEGWPIFILIFLYLYCVGVTPKCFLNT